MDPGTSFDTMHDPNLARSDRGDAAIALAAWLHGGGFPPADAPIEHVLDEIDEVLAALDLPDGGPDDHLEAAYEDRYELGDPF